MESPHSILKKVFGYDSFRPGQEEIVSRLLAGQDVLAVMPTGAGKSICYQVPALLLPGITIVVSPLVSLMKDQVGALVQAGVAAAFLNNSLTDNQKALMLRRAGPPAITPVPSGAGSSTISPVPKRPTVSCGMLVPFMLT